MLPGQVPLALLENEELPKGSVELDQNEFYFGKRRIEI
jgi:hypothetical protein